MKKITLIRHAKVDIQNAPRIYAQALSTWVNSYDTAEICSKSHPSQAVIHHAKDADIVLCSSLKRSHDSAMVLGVAVHEHNSLFDEVPIPHLQVSMVKLKPKTWLVILRLLLSTRLSIGGHSLQNVTKKAKKTASYLAQLSTYHDNIALVGHGGMNWLTHKALLQQGWKLEGKVSHKNWGTITLINTKVP